MKYSNAQIARHLGVKESDLKETAEREETGEIVAILSDFRKFVFPAAALKDAPQPVEPPPGEDAPLPVSVSGKLNVKK